MTGASDRWPEEPSRAGLVVDFDGTLAPIVDDPARAAMIPGAADALERLASGPLAAVAIISGRPASFLLERGAVPHVRLLGLYGLQQAVAGDVVVRPDAAGWQDAVDRARDVVAASLPSLPRGVALEDKGLSVAVHWRNTRDRHAAGVAVAAVVADVAAQTGLRREPGKLVEELRPPVRYDKGDAVRALVEECGLEDVAYVGDDLGDVPGFAAARSLDGLAVVVDHGVETPDAVRDMADVLLDGVDGTRAWLEALAARLG